MKCILFTFSVILSLHIFFVCFEVQPHTTRDVSVILISTTQHLPFPLLKINFECVWAFSAFNDEYKAWVWCAFSVSFQPTSQTVYEFKDENKILPWCFNALHIGTPSLRSNRIWNKVFEEFMTPAKSGLIFPPKCIPSAVEVFYFWLMMPLNLAHSFLSGGFYEESPLKMSAKRVNHMKMGREMLWGNKQITQWTEYLKGIQDFKQLWRNPLFNVGFVAFTHTGVEFHGTGNNQHSL